MLLSSSTFSYWSSRLFFACSFCELHYTEILFELKHFDILNDLEETHKSSLSRVLLFLKQNAFHKCYLIVRNLKTQGSLRPLQI